MRNIRKPKLNSIESITAFNKSKAELIMANVAMINAVTESTLRIYDAKRRSKMPVGGVVSSERKIVNECKVVDFEESSDICDKDYGHGTGVININCTKSASDEILEIIRSRI